MRLISIILVALAVILALYFATSRALTRRMEASKNVPSVALDSIQFKQEPSDEWPPILYGSDTIGKLISVARIEYRAGKPDSLLLYHGVLTGRPPVYQPDSLAAIDSSDNARFAHELRLVPLHSLSSGREHLGTLRLEPADNGITVVAASR